MPSWEIVLAALAALLLGAAALRYHATGVRRFEFFVVFFGVASVTSGLAMMRDGVEGTRSFLWMMPHDAPAITAAERPGTYAAHASSERPDTMTD